MRLYVLLRLRFCYEVGPTGYGLKRLIEDMGHACAVIAPSLIPRRLGERVKTNRRDAAELGETVDRLICEEDVEWLLTKTITDGPLNGVSATRRCR